MKKFYQQKEFLEEQKKWYDLLADDGFQDIEQMNWINGEMRERMVGNGCFASAGEAKRAYSSDLQRFWELASQYYWWLLESETEKPKYVELWRLYLETNSFAGAAREFGLATATATRHLKRMTAHMLEFKWREDDPEEESNLALVK